MSKEINIKDIFNKEYTFLNIDANTRDEALKLISEKAENLNIVENKDKLFYEFIKRENESSTGFEDGFSIPHARMDEIKKPTVFFVRYKNTVKWDTIDNQPIKISIVLMIPTSNENNVHLKILSGISKQIMNEKNRNILKLTTSYEDIANVLFSGETTKTPENIKNENTKKLLIGITACPVGVAHTYLAAEKLTETALKMGYNVKIETHGSSGVENEITDEEIKKADRVIIAADIGVPIEKFAGKRLYKTSVSAAIKKPKEVIELSETNSTILSMKPMEFNTNNSKDQKTGIMKHLMAGVSYMVPMVIVGGIFLALGIGMTKIIYGNEWLPGTPGNSPQNDIDHMLAGNHFLSYLSGIGGLAFALMIPILGGYIANSIAGRSAIVPAMLASYVGNSANLFFPIGGLTVETPTGFLGAIAIGIGIGFVVKWINTWSVPKNLRPVMPLFFMPIIVGGIASFLFVYAIGAPIGWVMNQFKTAISSVLMDSTTGIGVAIGMGFLIGAMSGFDLGGPINKIAFFTVSALVTEKVYGPMGMMATAGAVPPLAMFCTTVIFGKYFDKETKSQGISALVMGLIGIAEGAIPFAIRDPKRVIISNVIGSGVAGALGGAFLIEDYAAHTGPIVVFLGAVPYGPQTVLALLAIIIGVTVTTLIYGFWLVADSPKAGSVKEAYFEKVYSLKLDKNEKISNIKNEIAELKSLKKSSSETSDIDNKFIILNNKKQLVRSECKENISKAKNLMNKFLANENEYAKSQKNEIRYFNKENKSNFKLEKQNLKEDVYFKLNTNDKIAKKAIKEQLYNDLEIVSDRFIENEKQYQTKLRKKFVDEYLTELNI